VDDAGLILNLAVDEANIFCCYVRCRYYGDIQVASRKIEL
jgi:hypothetical protein